MPLMIGIGAPKKHKPSMPPPEAPGGVKRAPKPPFKKPALAIAIGASPKPASAPPDMPPPDPEMDDPAAAEADPTGAAGAAAGTGEVKPNPEAVDYRTSEETCGNCSYMQDSGMCSHPIVAQQVSPGDSCAAFDAREGEESDPNEQEPDQDADDMGTMQ